MAKKVVVKWVDDMDGTSAAQETVQFSLDRLAYELDLTVANAAELRAVFAPWIAHARRVRTVRNAKPAPLRNDKGENADIRQWGRANGYPVAGRGKISDEIRDAYRRALAS